MVRRIAPLLCVVGTLCLAAGLMPSGWGTAHARNDGRIGGTDLGLPFSPVIRSYRKVLEPPRSTTIDEEGRRVESSWHSSTVHGWEVRVFSWSALLVGLGLVLIVVSLRSRREAP